MNSTKEDSNSSSSTNSTDFMEDLCSSSSSSNGPLYQLSDIMDQLPIKRGLSKHYEGKSQSFASLASVESLEDLAKGDNPYKKRNKMYKKRNKFTNPKPTISKKISYSSSKFRGNCSNNFKAIHVQKEF